VRYPAGWYATAAPLTFVTGPRQILAVASYPLPHSNAGGDGCYPAGAFERMPAGGVFIFGWSYGRGTQGFPPQPRHFELRNLARYECMGRSYEVAFTAAGQAFQIHVAFGPRATGRARAEALQVLDSFTAARR
jgi:hypothetical protein